VTCGAWSGDDAVTPGDAGRLATESGARLLVLTHLWPTADHEQLLADARGAFAGDVRLASESMAIEIDPATSAGGGVSR